MRAPKNASDRAILPGRLVGSRSLWRDLAPAIVVLAAVAATNFGTFALLKHVGVDPRTMFEGWIPVTVEVVQALAALGALLVLIRLFEHRWASEIIGAGWPRALGRGSALGAALFTAVIATLIALGDARLRAGAGWRAALLATMLAFLAAIGEEAVFRGVLFRLIERHTGTAIALLVSAATFGLLHAGNPGATAMSSVPIAVEAGVLLAACYALTRTLWFLIGVHFAWNASESGVFGCTVSGFYVPGLLATRLTGSAWMTGGAFGPEAGLPAMITCLLVAAILLWLTVVKGEFVRFGRREPVRGRQARQAQNTGMPPATVTSAPEV